MDSIKVIRYFCHVWYSNTTIKLTFLAIFLRFWNSLFSKIWLRFKSNWVNFHSMIWLSVNSLFRDAFDLEYSVWKMPTRSVLKPTRSVGVHFRRGGVLTKGEDLLWFSLTITEQFGLPATVWLIGFPWPLTHQHWFLVEHWIWAYEPSSRHFGM